MPFLVIAGLTVPVVEGGATELPPERDGVSVRAADHTLRSAYSAESRGWRVTTGLMLQAEVDAVNNAVRLGSHVLCSGDALGGEVVCEITVGDCPYVNVEGGDGLGFMRTMALTLREAGANDAAPVITDTTEWIL